MGEKSSPLSEDFGLILAPERVQSQLLLPGADKYPIESCRYLIQINERSRPLQVGGIDIADLGITLDHIFGRCDSCFGSTGVQLMLPFYRLETGKAMFLFQPEIMSGSLYGF